MFHLAFLVHVFSLRNLFFSSILAETQDSKIVFVEFWIQLGCFISWILSFTLKVNYQSQVRLNLHNRLLCSLHCCHGHCHAVVGHRKQRWHKIDGERYVKRSNWGSYPLITPPNPSYDPKSSYPAQVFSRLLDDRGLNEFISTDFFHRSSLPLTSKQAARACVALTSDLKLTAASATCTKKSSSFVCPPSAHPNRLQHRRNNKRIKWSGWFYQLQTRGRLWSDWWINRANNAMDF